MENKEEKTDNVRNYNNRYRGFIISMTEVSKDRTEYRILNLDKTLIEDTVGYCVDTTEAMNICKETIDDMIDFN
jgi:hypothetical protein